MASSLLICIIANLDADDTPADVLLYYNKHTCVESSQPLLVGSGCAQVPEMLDTSMSASCAARVEGQQWQQQLGSVMSDHCCFGFHF